MSDRNNNPPVNMPENVPGYPSHTAQKEPPVVLFLEAGRYVAAPALGLMLYQTKPGEIGLGIKQGDQFIPFLLFPGTLTIEQKIEVPTDKEVTTFGQLVTP